MKKLFRLCRPLFVILVLLTTANHAHAQTSPGAIKKFDLLNKPTGVYGVARAWTSVTDLTRNNREIPLFIYYPTQSKEASTYIFPSQQWRDEYLPVLARRLGDVAAASIVNATGEFKDEGMQKVKFAVPRKAKLPVVLFSPGSNWSTLEYTYIIQEIVSAGYIVVAINSAPASPVIQVPAGRFITADRPADMYKLVSDDLTFVFEEIIKRKATLHSVFSVADFEKIAMAGHSLGGAACLLAANEKSVVKAVVNMDGDVMNAAAAAAPACAVLFLNQLPDRFAKKTFIEMQADVDAGWRYQQMSKSAGRAVAAKYVSIAGMYHSNFQDYALLPTNAIPADLRKTRLGPVDGAKCLQLISKSLLLFFDEHLKSKQVDWQAMVSQSSLVRIIDINAKEPATTN